MGVACVGMWEKGVIWGDKLFGCRVSVFFGSSRYYGEGRTVRIGVFHGECK